MSIKTQCAEVVKAFLRISDWLGRLSTLCLSDDYRYITTKSSIGYTGAKWTYWVFIFLKLHFNKLCLLFKDIGYVNLFLSGCIFPTHK